MIDNTDCYPRRLTFLVEILAIYELINVSSEGIVIYNFEAFRKNFRGVFFIIGQITKLHWGTVHMWKPYSCFRLVLSLDPGVSE